MKIKNEEAVYARRDRSPVYHLRGGVTSTRCGIELGVKYESYERIVIKKGITRKCQLCERGVTPKELIRFATV